VVDQQLENILGKIGVCASIMLYLSPLAVIRTVYERGYIESFSALPLLLACANAGLWCVYSLPAITPCHSDVLVANSIGVLLELVYIGTFVRYAGPRRKYVLTQLGCVTTVFAILVILGTAVASQLDFAPWPNTDPPITKQSSVLGFFCMFTNIAMFASPLAVIPEVRRTKSVEYMPIWITVGTIFCVSISRPAIAFALFSAPLPPIFGPALDFCPFLPTCGMAGNGVDSIRDRRV